MISNWSQEKLSKPYKPFPKNFKFGLVNNQWIGMCVLVLLLVLTPLFGAAQVTVGPEDNAEEDTTAANNFEFGVIEGDTTASSAFSEVSTFDDFLNFGDYSVEASVRRMAGVQVSRDGDINIRGAGYNTYAVTVNGFRLAPNGMGTRGFALDALSNDGLQSIELIKVVDPSMSADALAGVIDIDTENLVSEGDQRAMSAMFGGGANTKYISRTGPGSRGWIKYAERLTDELSFSVNVNFHKDFNSNEELQLGFGAEDFGNGFVDVYDRVSPGVNIEGHSRFSTSTKVQYEPSESSSYHFDAFFNTDNQSQTSHQDSWITGGDWIDQSTTGDEGEQGMFSHEAGIIDDQVTQLAFSAGGENEFDSYNLSYKAGWSQGKIESQHYVFPFQIEELNYALDLSTEHRPQMDITNRETQVLDDGTVDRQFMIGQDFDRTIQEHVNNQISARVDLEFPIDAGVLQAGVSSRLTLQDSEYGQNQLEYNRTLRMISFNMLREPNRNVDVINDYYRIPWFLNTDHARAFLESQRPLFTADDAMFAYQSEIRNHSSNEQIYGTYGLADLDFGDLDVKAGVRVEYDIFEVEGNEVTFNDEGEIGTIQPATENETRFNFFPHAQVGYQLAEGTDVNIAYSSTIDRPDYFPQTPFQRVDNQDSTIFSGNTQLEPTKAQNFDLELTQKLNTTGVISIAGFFKSLDNLIVQRQFSSNNFQQREFVNSNETATVYGAEVSVDQSLGFLPGVFGNLGVYANYTWSQSNFQAFENRGEMPLTGQSPHVVNAALNFEIPRFSAQVSYHWSDDLLTNIAETQQRAPALAQGPMYLDRYENGFKELSATASYQLSDRFRVWGNARHLINHEQISYLESEGAYPASTYIGGGFDLRVGVRVDL